MIDSNSIQASFFLDFRSDNTGRLEICDPVGFDSSNFTLEQESGRLGRDVSFAGGDIDLEFNVLTNIGGLSHQFNNLIRYYNTFGFESNVLFIINTNGTDKVIGELDFKDSETDIIKTFKCKVIQDSLQAKVKRRSDINVDLFSNTDIEGNRLPPLNTESIIIKATPLRQISSWELVNPIVNARNEDFFLNRFDLSFTPQITQNQIGVTLSPLEAGAFFDSTREQFIFLRAETSLTNISINLRNFTYSFDTESPVDNSPRPFTTQIVYRVGLDFSTSSEIVITIPNSGNNADFTIDGISLNIGDSLWIYTRVVLDSSGETAIFTNNVESARYDITATSLSNDTITQGVRLVDAMRRVVRSISGANIEAPAFENELHDQFIFTGSLLRNIRGREFNISLDDILNQIKEFYADYEIKPDGVVSFSLYDEFYPDNELAVFNQPAHLQFSSIFNDRYEINQINFEYENYEEGNNDDINQSYEGVHTECQMFVPNEMVENKKEIKLPWGRDPFWIEKIIRQGARSDESVSQEQDDDVAIISATTATNLVRNETLYVRHNVVGVENIQELILSSNGSFSFDLLGMFIGDVITISSQQIGTGGGAFLNNGEYQIISISPVSIRLSPILSSPSFNGEAFTTINYTITTATLITETNEAFSDIVGSTDTEGFANMRFTPKRNIINYYGRYLATASFFKPLGTITNTKFIHNGDFSTSLLGTMEFVTENQDIEISALPSPILKPFKVISEVFTDFDTAFKLMDDSRSTRGYISIINTNDDRTKIHASKLVFDIFKGVLIIEGEIRV